jgi:FixJ family two-component response regulator
MTAPAIVAVVDDDPRVLESVENLLQSAGRFVKTFASADALLAFRDLQQVACVVSDITMPGMDGFALQERLELERPGLHVIFITGHELAASSLMQVRPGHRLIRKPFEGTDLLAAVDAALTAEKR